METPPETLFLRDSLYAFPELVPIPRGKLQHKLGIIQRRSPTKQAGIGVDQFLYRTVNDLRNQPKINGRSHGDFIKRERIVGNHMEAISPGLLGNQNGGQDDGDVIACLAGKHTPSVELPEILTAGPAKASPNSADSPIVGSHGQQPVSCLFVKITEVAGGGAGGFFGVLPLVEPGVDAKPVLASLVGHKLPQPFGPGSRESEGV